MLQIADLQGVKIQRAFVSICMNEGIGPVVAVKTLEWYINDHYITSVNHL